MDSDVYSLDRLVWGGDLLLMERTPTDVTGVPAEASLICEADWETMAREAGGEGALMEALGVSYVAE